MSGSGERVWQMLRQRAKDTGADAQALAVNYAIERFMARLSGSDGESGITVKGGQSLGILFGNPMRPTKDLDIDVRVPAGVDPREWVRGALSAACSAGCDDGLSVDSSGLSFEVREHQGEGGLRVHVPASVHTCRASFVIDVGIGNEITFEPSRVTVDGILSGGRNAPPSADVRIYPHENTIAEKIVSKVEDGAASIRHKDFFDLWLCAEIVARVGDLRLLTDPRGPEEARAGEETKRRLSEGTLLGMDERGPSPECVERLGLALARTAAHRGTGLPEGLSDWLRREFAEDPVQASQFSNWCRNQKGRLVYSPPGTEPGAPKEAALSALFDRIAPLVDRIEEASMEHRERPPAPA